MKVNKVTMIIKVEVTHIQSVPALLCEASKAIAQETIEGQIRKEDGDEINWDTEITEVPV